MSSSSGTTLELSTLPAGNNNIGEVDIASFPAVDEAIFTNQTVANTTVNSSSFDVSHCIGAVIEAVYTGSSLQGSIKIQASLDNSYWFDFPVSAHTIAASGGNTQWHLSNLYVPYVRLSVTSTDSDTVTVTHARIYAKGA